jgi:ribosome biogenesis GTPase
VVVATAGRRVVVRDDEGERACFLSGQRAVVGDRVRWVEARGEGGKVTSVAERDNALVRADERGREQVLAANLAGVLIVCAPVEPAFRAGLVDRYLVAAGVAGLAAAVVLNKVDQGVPEVVEAELALRVATGVELLRTSTVTGEGMEALRERIASTERPWALVGHSGTGKTSIAAALLPGVDVGAIGELSEYWGQGRHTTTGSRLFEVPTGGRLVDSPGIRTFAPGRIDAEALRDWFPGVGPLGCRYRDCLHREGEDGCVAEAEVPAELLVSYRRLLAEILRLDDRRKPWT